MQPSDPAAVTFGHVALVTADLDRFRRFYEDVFGLAMVSVDHPDGAWFRRLGALTDAPASAVRILAFEVPGYVSGMADDVVGRRGRLDHLALVTNDPVEFELVARRLVELGASSGAVIDLGPMRSMLFVDPDGAHHHLETPNPDWVPGRAVEITHEALWRRLRPPAA